MNCRNIINQLKYEGFHEQELSISLTTPPSFCINTCPYIYIRRAYTRSYRDALYSGTCVAAAIGDLSVFGNTRTRPTQLELYCLLCVCLVNYHVPPVRIDIKNAVRSYVRHTSTSKNKKARNAAIGLYHQNRCQY
jgi:hypothetical protein